MAANLADAYCTIVPRFDGLKKSLEGEISKADGTKTGARLAGEIGRGAQGGIGDIFKGTLLANLATSALTGVASAVSGAISQGAHAVVSGISSAVSGAAETEQLMGGVKKIFGEDTAATVADNATSAFERAGISANDYMTQVTSFSASLLQSMGGDTQAAAAMADQAIVDMSDNANVYGSNIEDIQNAYQGFAKQNYTMLDNLKLGYGGTKEEMQRLIADANAWGAANGAASDLSIDSYADVIQAIHQIQVAQGIAGDTAMEAAGTVTGSVAQLKAAWSNLVNSVGTEGANFESLATSVTSSLQGAFNNVLPTVTNVFNGVSQVLPALFSGLASVLPEMVDKVLNEAIPSILASVTSIISTVAGVLQSIDWTQVTAVIQTVISQVVGQILPAIIGLLPVLMQAGLSIVLGIAQGLAAAAPQIIAAISAIVPQVSQVVGQILPLLLELLPTFLQVGISIVLSLVQGLAESAPQIIAAIGELIPQLVVTIVENIPQIIAGAQQLFIGIVEGLSQALPSIITGIIGAIPQMVSALVHGLPQMLAGAVQLFGAIVSAIPQILGAVISGIGGLIGDAVGWITGNGPRMLAEAAGQMMQGFVNGIADMGGAIMDAIGNAVGGAVDFVKSILGIHSPSRVFAQIGAYTMQGMAGGIERGASSVIGAYAGVVDELTGQAPTLGVDFDATGGAGIAGGTVYNVRIDGATVNDDEQIRSDVRALLVDLHRKAVM